MEWLSVRSRMPKHKAEEILARLVDAWADQNGQIIEYEIRREDNEGTYLDTKAS